MRHIPSSVSRSLELLVIPLVLVTAIAIQGGRVSAQTQVFAAPLSPVYGTVGNPVTFSASLFSSSVPTVSQFVWDFGDGQAAYGSAVTHTYQVGGVYNVTVTALAGSAAVATTSTTASINQRTNGVVSVNPGVNSVPVPLGFVGVNAGGPYNAIAGQPVTMQGTASNASSPQFTWDFGDGQSGTGPAVSHVYAAPGNYTAHLSVTDLATGTAGSAYAPVNVGGPGSPPLPSQIPVAGPVIGPSGPSVTVPSGWNLIAGPTGTSFPQALSPIFTWRPGDTSYELLPSSVGVQGGAGYWAFFPQPATVVLAGVSQDSASIPVPPGQMVLVGNPSATQAVVIHGADSALLWDATASQYRSVQALAPGAGAWVSVAAGGVVTLSP